MILQLNPPIYLDTPKGAAYAAIVTDCGFDHSKVWTCVVIATGEIWDFETRDVLASKNVTYGVNLGSANVETVPYRPPNETRA